MLRTGLRAGSTGIRDFRPAVRPSRFIRESSTAAAMGRAYAAAQRGASFGFNTVIVVFGIGVVGVTGYYLAKELLLPSSDGQLFHKAFKLVENDVTAVKLLGLPLKAHGEPTNQRNVKTRPIASNRGFDRFGQEHVWMQFHIDGSKNKGLARLEVVENQGKPEFRYLVVEAAGKRHFIINNESVEKPKRSGGLFGIKWGPHK